MKNLIIDIGNTRTKMAVFGNGELLEKTALTTSDVAALQRWAYNQKAENAILSSTAKVPASFEAFLKKN
ncbi:MAG TPA: type III pantothenate kinase, partial [Bacteroidetes bacterium]|nr:type III pantothenate kinase [Bacteroidota bacterium]